MPMKSLTKSGVKTLPDIADAIPPLQGGDGARKVRTITPEKVADVKIKLRNSSVQEAARLSNVSYTTAWHVSKGHYDNQTAPMNGRENNKIVFFNW